MYADTLKLYKIYETHKDPKKTMYNYVRSKYAMVDK